MRRRLGWRHRQAESGAGHACGTAHLEDGLRRRGGRRREQRSDPGSRGRRRSKECNHLSRRGHLLRRRDRRKRRNGCRPMPAHSRRASGRQRVRRGHLRRGREPRDPAPRLPRHLGAAHVQCEELWCHRRRLRRNGHFGCGIGRRRVHRSYSPLPLRHLRHLARFHPHRPSERAGLLRRGRHAGAERGLRHPRGSHPRAPQPDALRRNRFSFRGHAERCRTTRRDDFRRIRGDTTTFAST